VFKNESLSVLWGGSAGIYDPYRGGVRRGKRWQYQPSLSFYEQYSDNVDLLEDNKVTAFITEISPGVTMLLPSPRRQVKADMNLKFDYRKRSDGKTESLYWYSLWGYVGQQYSPRTTYEVSASYDITYAEKDLKQPFTGVFSSLTRADTFSIEPGLGYNLTKLR